VKSLKYDFAANKNRKCPCLKKAGKQEIELFQKLIYGYILFYQFWKNMEFTSAIPSIPKHN